MKNMEYPLNKLFIGETTKFSAEMLDDVFSEIKVYFAGFGDSSERKGNWLNLSRIPDLSSYLKSYSIGEVIYFSSFLSDDKNRSDEAEQLDSILQQLLGVENVKFLYVSGPDVNYETESSRKILADSLEQICQHYAHRYDMDIKVLRSLHLDIVIDDRKDKVHPDQKVTYVYPQDLLILLDRILDSWSKKYEVLSISSYFDVCYRELMSNLNMSPEETAALFDEELAMQVLREIPRDLRQRYTWIPLVSVLENPPVYDSSHHQKDGIRGWLKKIYGSLQQPKSYVMIIGIVIFFLLTELLVRVLGDQIYFKFLDYRLLFVMISGLLFGTSYGLFAALLSGVGLVSSYLSSGWTLNLLFFNISNWLPFFVYFFVGGVSGSVYERYKEERTSLTLHGQVLQEQLNNERQMSDLLLNQQGELIDQIISSENSYGRVYEIVRDWNTPYLDILFMRALHHLSDIFETKELAIYIATTPEQAYLVMSGEQAHKEKTMDLTHLEHALQKVESQDIWVNYRLNEHYPMYMSALTATERPTIYLLIQHLPSTKLNLHYQNTFKILSNLLQIAYDHALSVRSRSPFLSEKDFRDKISLVQDLEIADFEHLLFRLGKKGEADSIFQKIRSQNRVTDTFCEIDGYLYFLTHSHSSLSLAEWLRFFEFYGIDAEYIQDFDQFIGEIE